MRRKAQWAWISLDIGNSAFATSILAAVFPVYFPHLLPSDGVNLQLFGWSWQSSAIAIWGYAVSFSIFLTLIISPILGSWADESSRRKFCLLGFSILGSFFTILLGVFRDWQLVLACFVLANVGFAASNIFYNSLISSVADESEWDQLSLKAYAWGYVGGGILLALNLVMIQNFSWFGLESKAAGSRLSFISVGVWWMLFTMPSLFWIQELKKEKTSSFQNRIHDYVFKLGVTLKTLPKIPSLLIFIFSFAFFNDGIQTVISMASIYGKEVMGLPEGQLIGTLLMIQFLGWPMTLGMIRLTRYFGTKRLLSLSLVIWLFLVIYAYQMKTSLDFWILGFFVAMVLGVSQALARSLYARLIPEGRQAEFFSLYALSGKMSSMMGPLVFGIVQDMTGNARYSILSLALFFLLGIALLQGVSIDPKRKASLE
ncbi:MAG: MFS transporter [Bdellovibrionota bacterium]